jgi:hypothetical protein
MTRALALWLLAIGCARTGDGRVIYRDPVVAGFAVKHNEHMHAKAGELGAIHPAVLEYVLASPEGPLAAYYDFVLALPDRPLPVTADLERLAGAARALGGDQPTGEHYARALARMLAPHINRALSTPGGEPVQEGPQSAFRVFEGTAGLWWGVPVDLEAGTLLRDYERPLYEYALRTVVYRHASVSLVAIRSSGTAREYVWDVSEVPGAFDPSAELDHERVAATIARLHPFTTPPGEAP